MNPWLTTPPRHPEPCLSLHEQASRLVTSNSSQQPKEPPTLATPLWQGTPTPKEAPSKGPCWQPADGIIRVCFEARSARERRCLQQALSQWNQAFEGKLRLEEHPYKQGVTHPASGYVGIAISYKASPTLGRPNDLGHTDSMARPQEPQATLIHSHIQLVAQPLIDTRLTEAQQTQRLTATLLHELGHALGLEHHPKPSSVMYYRGWASTLLSNDDTQALMALYQPFFREY